MIFFLLRRYIFNYLFLFIEKYFIIGRFIKLLITIFSTIKILIAIQD
jgi:hypothetical protein